MLFCSGAFYHEGALAFCPEYDCLGYQFPYHPFYTGPLGHTYCPRSKRTGTAFCRSVTRPGYTSQLLWSFDAEHGSEFKSELKLRLEES